ncbi:MAG: hypothetical protein CFE28_11015 [Alphaproteobacteria bacterium PA2]|nr:MAG: hypothetical protein CFE28_11015 [Alphaproteobacteria bacterium PA2]
MTMNVRLMLKSSTAIVVSLCMAAFPSSAETLSEVIAYAYDNNPGLQAQRAAVRAADESYVQARAGYGLNISAQAGETSYEIRRDGAKADAITNSMSVTAVQPLYTGGRVRARVSEAEAQILAGREQLRRYEMDVMVRVVAAYAGVRRDEQLLKIAQETVAVLQRGLEDTQAKYDVRTVTLTDLAQSRARLSQARTQLFNAQEQLAATRSQFLAVVGQNPGQLEPLPPLEQLPASLDTAFDTAESHNPQLLGAQFNEQASRARIARAKANGMPTVTARAEMQRSPYLPYQGDLYDDSRSASVVFSQPIFSAGQIRSAIRQSVEENNRDRLSVEEVRLQLVSNVAQAWEHMASLRQQLQTLQEEVKSNELAFLGVRAEERYALRSNIEILNAQAELNAAQQNLARAQTAEYVSRVQLLALTGTLTPQVLSDQVETYDPKRNFKRVKYRGVTPLDVPVIILDAVGSLPTAKPRPASRLESRPQGAEAQPTPAPPKPMTSVLDIIKKDPGATSLPPTQ